MLSKSISLFSLCLPIQHILPHKKPDNLRLLLYKEVRKRDGGAVPWEQSNVINLRAKVRKRLFLSLSHLASLGDSSLLRGSQAKERSFHGIQLLTL